MLYLHILICIIEIIGSDCFGFHLVEGDSHPEQRSETATVEKPPEANPKRMTVAEVTKLLSAFPHSFV